MDEKIKLYKKILREYYYPNNVTFLSTDDIEFDFKSETYFIKKSKEAYNIFIEENNYLYRFELKFKNFNDNSSITSDLRFKNDFGTVDYCKPNIGFSDSLNNYNKFDFIIDNFSNIIKQIKSERIFSLLLGQKVKL